MSTDLRVGNIKKHWCIYFGFACKQKNYRFWSNYNSHVDKSTSFKQIKPPNLSADSVLLSGATIGGKNQDIIICLCFPKPPQITVGK